MLSNKQLMGRLESARDVIRNRDAEIEHLKHLVARNELAYTYMQDILRSYEEGDHRWVTKFIQEYRDKCNA